MGQPRTEEEALRKLSLPPFFSDRQLSGSDSFLWDGKAQGIQSVGLHKGGESTPLSMPDTQTPFHIAG